MTVEAISRAEDTQVLDGNGWSYDLLFPLTDDAGQPVTYGNWSATSPTGINPTVTTTTGSDGLTVTLTLDSSQVSAIPARWLHWYLHESAEFGDDFLTGRIEKVTKR